MNCFLIFSCKILKSHIFFFYFSELIQVSPRDSRLDSLAGSSLEPGVITIFIANNKIKKESAHQLSISVFLFPLFIKGKGNISKEIALS
jgi:hypothetical protein